MTTSADDHVCSIHDDLELDRLRRTLKLEPHSLARVRFAFYQQQRSAEQVLQHLPAGTRAAFAAQVRFHCLKLINQRPSNDGATKLVFEIRGGSRIESVILRSGHTKRTTLCVSSQVGCAARCRFCATGQMPRVTNLSRDEILDQVAQANLLLQPERRRIRNIVFMGMGEPLHNEDSVIASAQTMFSNHHFNLAPRRTVLSTVGVPAGMIRWARRFRRAPVALSLHSACQETRETIIPWAKSVALPELRQSLEDVVRIQEGPVLIEYLLLDGINNRSLDVELLQDFVTGIPSVINLIPFNPVDHAPELREPSQICNNQFAAALRGRGLTVTFRHSLGRAVDAACGQLAAATTDARLHTVQLSP